MTANQIKVLTQAIELCEQGATRVDKEADGKDFVVYWVGPIIRVDIKVPKIAPK